MKTNRGVFLTLALVGGEWSASRFGRFNPGERAYHYPLERMLGGPHSRSTRHGEVKLLVPTGTRTPTPWFQPITSLYTDCVVAAASKLLM
jgi:hypothetical protein